MASRLNDNENFLLSCAARVDAGKHRGQQERDVRIDITGHAACPPLAPETSTAILERACERLNAFLNLCVARTPPDMGMEEGAAFETAVASMLNAEFGTSDLVITRFIIIGVEPSVEAMMLMHMPVPAPLQ